MTNMSNEAPVAFSPVSAPVSSGRSPYLVFERAADGVRTPIGVSSTHLEALGVARAATTRTGRATFVCHQRAAGGAVRRLRQIEEVRPDGTVVPASFPRPVSTTWRPRPWSSSAPPPSRMSSGTRQCMRRPSLDVVELVAYVDTFGASVRDLRLTLERYLDDDVGEVWRAYAAGDEDR